MNPDMMSVLTFSTLFPNAARPTHGIFVARRLEHLVNSGGVLAHVIAPVPWRPGALDHPELGRLDCIPHQSRRGVIPVEHPRYAVIPKVGMNLAPALLYRAGKAALSRLLKAGRTFDLIDAHYFYPDGVAASWLGRTFGLPVVITARGTDLNLIPQYRLPRMMIRHAAARADGLITVCDALKKELISLGAAADKVQVLRNGVDLKQFQPRDRESARRKYGVAGAVLLSVGLLIERKGHHHVIKALTDLPEATLLIAGQGPLLGALKKLAADCGVGDRVRFLGNLDPDSLCLAYNAADVLVLASSREGWANVLLEAMACGTPVAASPIWGTPEVVRAPEAGQLMPSTDAPGVVQAVTRLLADPPRREATRCYAEKFGWEPTTQGQLALFRSILERRSALSQTGWRNGETSLPGHNWPLPSRDLPGPVFPATPHRSPGRADPS